MTYSKDNRQVLEPLVVRTVVVTRVSKHVDKIKTRYFHILDQKTRTYFTKTITVTVINEKIYKKIVTIHKLRTRNGDQRLNDALEITLNFYIKPFFSPPDT